MIGAFVLSSAATVLAAGGLMIGESYQSLKAQKQHDELAIARNVAVQLDGLIARTRATVESLSRQPDIVSMDPARQRAAMTILANVSALIDNIVITDLSGRNLRIDASNVDAARILPISPLETFVKPVLQSRGVTSVVYRSRAGKVVLSVNAPILSEKRIVAVITAGILTTNDNFGYVENVRIGRSGFAYVVDAKGRVIVHPRHELLFVDNSSSPPVREAMRGREGTVEFRDGDGVDYLAAFAPMRRAQWGVVVQQTKSESYLRAEGLYYFLVSILIVSLLCSIAIGAVVSLRLVKPISELAKGARAVSTGRFDTRVPVLTKDELGDLAAAFNEMAARLKQTLATEKLVVVGQLAAGLAHEINNPLNVISGFADFVRSKTPEGDPRREALDDISRETLRCQRLVTQLLDLARPKETVRVSANINESVREIAALIKPQAVSAGIETEMSLAERLPPVELDVDQMKQVLLNLSLNSCQAMSQGGRLRLSTREQNGRILVSIGDNGPGISTEDRERLFTPFFTTKVTGTGLGLATSRAIIESHGGTLELDDSTGAGATFTISLPATGGAHDARG